MPEVSKTSIQAMLSMKPHSDTKCWAYVYKTQQKESQELASSEHGMDVSNTKIMQEAYLHR
jgi:hypothetical protein